jgi:hydrogenase/urease accessory protein HupE
MRSKLAVICREPLAHFLALGAGIFLLWHFVSDRLTTQPERILITPGQVERLAQAWTKTHLRPPSADELAGLVEQEIDEEILYREAVALGLDRDDLVIRRRLAVKMDFLTDDLAAAANPTEEQLKAFLRQHPEKFNVEPLTTFAQVFINRSQRGEKATAEATRLLTLLNDKADSPWQSLGDSLPLPNQLEAASAADIARHFGREFPHKLAALPVGRWSGPVESKYGLHLIRIQERTAGRTPPLHEVREAVLNAWRAEQRQELTAILRKQRRARYAVTVQWPDWANQAATLTAGGGGSQGGAMNRSLRWLAQVVMFWLALESMPQQACAHESRPGYLELREVEDGHYEALWKQPAVGDLVLRLTPIFPDSCTLTHRDRQLVPGAMSTRLTLSCPGGLAGSTIRFAGLEDTITNVLVRVYHRDGSEETHLVYPHAPSVTIRGAASWTERARSYLQLGVMHILLGVDHLLFVLGLLLIIRDRWMLVKTVSAFTVAHSLTLAIATLGYASVPAPPLNVVIALSIFFLGPEIARTWRGQTSFTIRHPWVVAFAFGLLHGFGFASGLTATGLPRGEIPLALLLFNVGVEIGQLGFVFLVLLLERSFRQLEIHWPVWVAHAPGYLVGSLGAFWTLQRAAIMVGVTR